MPQNVTGVSVVVALCCCLEVLQSVAFRAGALADRAVAQLALAAQVTNPSCVPPASKLSVRV